MPKYSISVNGKMMSVEVDDDTPVLWILRDHLNILGPKFSCGVAQCGAVQFTWMAMLSDPACT